MLGKQINGGMLLLARKKRRKTQIELANETGIPQAALSRIENGTKDALSSEEVQKVARVLGFPISFFYEQESLYRHPISVHSAAFRKRASVSVKDSDAAVASANHYILHLRRLIDAVDLQSEFPLLQFEVVGDKNTSGEHAFAVSSATEAAAKVRAAWQVGSDPLLSLTRYVEASGVIVVHADFAGADIDGLTLRPTGMRPVIVLNTNRPADRMRFSLAHEFGHVVLHPFPYDAMEKEANEFAAELLMPRDGILTDLRGRLTVSTLGRLKIKWRTAMAALIYRAKFLGAIQEYEATSLWKQMSAHGYRTREPEEFDFERETTKLVGDLIGVHTGPLGYSVTELAEALQTLPAEFSEMHGLGAVTNPVHSKPKLRIVSSRDS